MQDNGHLAMTCALDELYGLGYAHESTTRQRIEAVTAEQVREVAKKYVKDDSLTVAVLDPQPLEQKLPSAGSGGLRH